MSGSVRAVILLTLLAAPPAGAVGERIVAVEVHGNSKTNDETVRDIAGVSKGDRLVDGLVERVTLDLLQILGKMNCSLAPR